MSNIGGPDPRVLARFTRNERGLYMERFDRRVGRWVPDSSVAGFDIGFDDWAEAATKERAEEILACWGFASALVDAPVVEPATT